MTYRLPCRTAMPFLRFSSPVHWETAFRKFESALRSRRTPAAFQCSRLGLKFDNGNTSIYNPAPSIRGGPEESPTRLRMTWSQRKRTRAVSFKGIAISPIAMTRAHSKRPPLSTTTLEAFCFCWRRPCSKWARRWRSVPRDGKTEGWAGGGLPGRGDRFQTDGERRATGLCKLLAPPQFFAMAH